MAFVSITRLRLRGWRFLPGFFLHAQRSERQVQRAEGFVEGAVLADRHRTFWTMTLWRDQADMRRYMTSGAHRDAMPKLMHWCDEASIVHWQPDEMALPSWTEADHWMRTEGRPSKVLRPSPDHDGLDYREPRTTRTIAVRRAG